MSLFDCDFRQTFSWAPNTGSDARGDETFGDIESAPCRFQPSDRLARASDGTQVVSSGIIYTNVALTTDDRIWPPGTTPGDVSQARRPISVMAQYALDGSGVDHWKVVF